MSAVYQKLSPSHRAVLALANMHFTGRVPDDLGAVFGDCVPEDLVRIAQSNHIHTLAGRVILTHPALQEVLARDLCLYLTEMYRANQVRLAAARDQLAEIEAAFVHTGIAGVVMKGGGDVLDPLHADPAIRFSSDLDILVGQAQAAQAEALLLDLGAQSMRAPASEADEGTNWRGVKYAEHHLPKIVHDDWLLPVEIHVMAGRGAMDRLLPAAALLAGRDAGLSVMGPEDRACHLMAHADHHGGDVDLRAWIDWSALRGRCDRAELQKRLAGEGLAPVFATFEAMAGHLEGEVAGPVDALWHDPVVEGALRNFGGTDARRRAYGAGLVKRKGAALLKSSEYRAYVLRQMMRPGWWKQVWREHKARGRNQR